MSTLGLTPLLFLWLTTCRVDPKRESVPGGPSPKLTRGDGGSPPEIFPRVIEEPQPIADAVLVQPQVSECLARAASLSSPGFSVELSGRVTGTGRVVGARAFGVEPPVARCLEGALADLLLLPNGPGEFRLNLSRTARSADPGVLIDPAGGKKFE